MINFIILIKHFLLLTVFKKKKICCKYGKLNIVHGNCTSFLYNVDFNLKRRNFPDISQVKYLKKKIHNLR